MPEKRELVDARIRQLAAGLGMQVHDVWAYEMGDGYYVEVHLETDGALPLRQAHEPASDSTWGESRVVRTVQHDG